LQGFIAVLQRILQAHYVCHAIIIQIIDSYYHIFNAYTHIKINQYKRQLNLMDFNFEEFYLLLAKLLLCFLGY